MNTLLTLPLLLVGSQGGSDDCSQPELITAQFSGFVDLTGATTGAEGQFYSACSYQCVAGSNTAIENDVWFLWTATGDELVDCWISNTDYGDDFKMAVYEGNACASAPPLECSDDGAGFGDLTPWLRFEAQAGMDYLIQVGASPGTVPNTGSLKISSSSLDESYSYDDGDSDSGWYLAGDGEIAWIQRYSARGGSDSIAAVWSSFGIEFEPEPADGTAVSAHIWEDPDDDGFIDDAILVGSAQSTVQLSGTDVLIRIPFDAPVPVFGDFFVGVSLPLSSGVVAAPTDDGWFGTRSWIASNGPGAFDPNCLGCNSTPPILLVCHPTSPTDGVFLLRAEGAGGYAEEYCSQFFALSTCFLSSLAISGSPSSASSDFRLEATKVYENKPGLMFWATEPDWLPLGVNFKCVASPSVRTPIQFSGSTQVLGVCGGTFSFDWTSAYLDSWGLDPGASIHAQFWYRDPMSTSGTALSTAAAFVVLP